MPMTVTTACGSLPESPPCHLPRNPQSTGSFSRRTAENIQQVANPERNDTQHHVHQHVVEDGQGEGNGLDFETATP